MAAITKLALVLLWAAADVVSSCSCDCEAQREEIERLRATILNLREQASQVAVVPRATPARRAAGTPTCDGDYLELESDEELQTLEGCRSLRHLKIGGDGVTSLAALHSLETALEIEIDGADTLISLAGLENLREVGSLVISDNHNLTSLAGLQSLLGAGHITVKGNGELRSLAGLAGLTNVGTLNVESNGHLLALGLESLQSAEHIGIDDNAELTSLAGLENLPTAESLVVQRNHALESLQGLEGLTSLKALTVSRNQGLLSTSGLGQVQTVQSSLRIELNTQLESLEIGSLTSVGHMTISANTRLTSLSGLRSLQTAESVNISISAFQSLQGLGSLEHVWGDFVLLDNEELVSLEGLERLQSVELFRIEGRHLELQSLFPGLQSLVRAYRGLDIEHCRLLSLRGLGALYQAAKLQVQTSSSCNVPAAHMQFLGGPFAAGARIGWVSIDEGTWPLCTTPHEHLAFISATNSPSVPSQRCESRELLWPLACVRGQPCSFSVANFSIDGLQGILGSVFVSDLHTGCGACPENHLQSKITSSRVVEFGSDAFRDEEVGQRSLCLCGASGRRGPVGQFLLRGPRRSGVAATCLSGHSCTVRLHGEALERTDQVMLAGGACDEGARPWNPQFVARWADGNASENQYLLDGPTEWYEASPSVYQVCWRGPCSAGEPDCAEAIYLNIGQVTLLGPVDDHLFEVIFGEDLAVANKGLGVSDLDRMRIMRSCGEANEDGTEAPEANSSGKLFKFGTLTEAHVLPGRHHLCWCQVRDGVKCEDARDFMAKSGEVQMLCRAGQELVEGSDRCTGCPAGRQRPEALDSGPHYCTECPAGQFSPGGESGCQTCSGGTFAEEPGSPECVPCQGWESATDGGAGCSPNPPVLALLSTFALSVCALCAFLALNFRRQLSIVDVSLDDKRTIITTFGPHRLVNFGRASFPVMLRNTGHPGLDSPSEPLRARVHDTARLELLTQQGSSIRSELDSSMGTLLVPFPHTLRHQGWPAPLVVGVPVLFWIVVALGAPILTADMAAEACVAVAAGALVGIAGVVTLRMRRPATPLVQSLTEFQQKLARQNSTRRCEKGSGRAIQVSSLQQLLDSFHEFLRDRTAYFLVSHIILPLTKAHDVSYAELVGPGEVEWFVSHFWGTAYSHFCMALQKHAKSVNGNYDWIHVRYWVCFCSNNQHRLEEELGAGWQQSSFYVTLKSGQCRGTCMVLDDQALPLTRIWCIFELLQTVKLERADNNFQGLIMCSSSGVLNTGSGNVEVAMELAKRVATMDLATARATKGTDAEQIRAEVIREMGSFTALNTFVCHEVYHMLAQAQSSTNEQFVAVLKHLERSVGGDVMWRSPRYEV